MGLTEEQMRVIDLAGDVARILGAKGKYIKTMDVLERARELAASEPRSPEEIMSEWAKRFAKGDVRW